MTALTPGWLTALTQKARSSEVDRLVLADAYEEAGRLDVARLWRDQLPERPYKRRHARIDKLSKAQSADMRVWAQKWIGVGLSTERADRPLFEAAVACMHRLAFPGHPTPVVAWCPSPIVAVMAGPLIAKRLAQDRATVRDTVRVAVRVTVADAVDGTVRATVRTAVIDAAIDAVEATVRDAVRDAVGATVEDTIRDTVRATVGATVEDAVRDATVADTVEATVRATVGDTVGVAVRVTVADAVDGTVRATVGDTVRDAVIDTVGDAAPEEVVRDNWYRYFGGQFWVGGWWWGSPSYVSFFLDRCGLEMPPKVELAARAYAAACSSACWWWPQKDFVCVSERPMAIEFHDDTRKKLKRIAWDGWAIDVDEAGGRKVVTP